MLYGAWRETSMRHRVAVRVRLIATFICFNISFIPNSIADEGDQLLTVDHYVSVHSTVPFMAGQTAAIYGRERLPSRLILSAAPLSDRVLLFVHCAGTPPEGAVDAPYPDCSWSACPAP